MRFALFSISSYTKSQSLFWIFRNMHTMTTIFLPWVVFQHASSWKHRMNTTMSERLAKLYWCVHKGHLIHCVHKGHSKSWGSCALVMQRLRKQKTSWYAPPPFPPPHPHFSFPHLSILYCTRLCYASLCPFLLTSLLLTLTFLSRPLIYYTWLCYASPSAPPCSPFLPPWYTILYMAVVCFLSLSSSSLD